MEIRRPLLLTLSILYAILSNSGVSSTDPIKKKFLNYRRLTALSNNDNCVCFENPTSDTLDKVLDADDKGLERLIIYVYKDSQNQLKIYVPNIRKQLNFPDFAFENGDLINTDAYQSIFTAFNTSPNVVTVNPKKVADQPTSLDRDYKTNQEYSNPVHIHHVEDIPSNAIPHQHISLPHAIHSSNYANPAQQSKGNMENPKYTQNNGKSDHIPTHAEQKIYGNPIPAADYEKILFQGKPLGPIFSMFNQSIKNDSNSKTFDQWFGEEMKHTDVAESIKSNPMQLSTLEDLIQAVLTDHGIKLTSKGILTDSNGNVLDMSNLHLRPVLIGDTLEYEKVRNHSKKTFSVPADLPYLESLLITLQFPPKVLGIIPLRKIYIPSKDLTPQSTNSLQSLFSPTEKETGRVTVYNENYQFPPLPQYIDNFSTKNDLSGVTTAKKVQKAKKKGNYPQDNLKSQQVKLLLAAQQSSSVGDDDNKGFKLSQVNDEQRRKHGGKGNNNYVEIANGLKQFGYYKSESAEDVIAELLQQVITQDQGATGHDKAIILDKQTLIQTLPIALRSYYAEQESRGGKIVKKDLLQNSVPFPENKVHDFNGIPRSYPRSESNSNQSSKPNSILGKLLGKVVDRIISRRQDIGELVEDLSGPDFRIIGGAAATGSGSPISNRGRSGFIE